MAKISVMELCTHVQSHLQRLFSPLWIDTGIAVDSTPFRKFEKELETCTRKKLRYLCMLAT